MHFDDFVRARAGSLIGLATAMSGDRHLAEDMVQEVLLKAHSNWRKIESLDDPSSYVRRMVVNEYLSWRRRWSRVVPFAQIDPPETEPDPATALADRAALMQQLRALTRRQRAVLALRFYAGMADDQIATTLGCSAGAVRTSVSRALSAMRTQSDALLPSVERNGQ